MRVLALAIAAAFAIATTVPVMAEDTTIIKKHQGYDNGGSKVIIKKKENTYRDYH